MDRLRHAAPTTAVFLQRAAERGRNLGNATAKLLELLDEYGATLLEPAIAEVVARDVIHVPAVRQLLEQRRHAQGRPLPIAVALTEQRLRDVVVRPHDLATYDRINKDDDDDHEAT